MMAKIEKIPRPMICSRGGCSSVPSRGVGREGTTHLDNEANEQNRLCSRVNRDVVARVERSSSTLNAERHDVDSDEDGGDPLGGNGGPLGADVGDDA